MKKNKNIMLIFMVVGLSMCGCDNLEISDLSDIYEGETVDINHLYSLNKDDATKFLNYYIYDGKVVDPKYYENYCCFSYDETPKKANLGIPYRNLITIMTINEEYYPLAFDYSNINSTEYYLSLFKENSSYVTYKNVIYQETYMAYIILFGIPDKGNGDYYFMDGEDKVFFCFDEQKFCEVNEVRLADGYYKTYGQSFMANKRVKKVQTNPELQIIGPSTFYGCRNLTEVTLNDGLKEICDGAFQNCDSLEKILLPKSLEEISRKAFDGCSSLRRIVVPENVYFIGEKVFSHGNIYCEAKSKPDKWHNNFAYKDAKVYWADEWKYDENNNPVPLVEK